MILLRQRQAPTELLANQQKWTARWDTQRPKQWATARARKLLNAHIHAKSHGKCVFCESVLDVTDFSHIEHYHAKTVRPELAFDWHNLFLACAYCNITKRDTDHAGRLLKPDTDDGEQHFWFNPSTGELQAKGERAEESIRLCNLNRPALCQERLRQHQLIDAILDQFKTTGTLLKKLRPIAFYLLSPRAKYKLVVRAALPHKIAERDRQKYHAAR